MFGTLEPDAPSVNMVRPRPRRGTTGHHYGNCQPPARVLPEYPPRSGAVVRFLTPVLLSACLILAGEASAAQSATFMDGHVHLNDPAAWVAAMDDAGIQAAVALRGRSIGHAGLIEAAEAWPGRILPFVSISPEHREFRGSWDLDDPSVGEVVDSLLRTGAFHGIGEISVSHFPGAGFPEADYDPDGVIMNRILEVARQHDVPVLVHSEITRLREFEALLAAHPEVQVIWAHGGYTPLFVAERMLSRHPNLTYELSARTWIQHPRSPDYTILWNGEEVWPQWLELVESMPGRFIVGTDASMRSTESDRLKIDSVRNFLAQLTPSVRTRVAHLNLSELLQR